MMNKKLTAIVSLLVLAGLVLGACQPATPAPGEPAAPAEETLPPTTAFIPAEEMIPCLPLPELALGGGESTYAAVTEQVVAREAASKVFGKPVYGEPEQAAEVIYRVGVFEDVTTLNYWAANGPDNTVWNAYMLPPRITLYELADKYFYFVPNAAVDLPDPLVQEGDFWVVEIPIREDIQWSDGTPFTAEDVAFTANAVLELGLISGNWSKWYDANFLEKVEAVGDFTVKYYFHTKPGLSRYQYGVLSAPILSKAYWEAVVEEAVAPIKALAADASEEDVLAAKTEAQRVLFAHEAEGEPFAGTHLFGSWEQGAFLEVTTNPDFYDSDVTVELWPDGSYRTSDGFILGDPQGDPETVVEVGPFTEGVIYSYYGSQDAAILALEAGEVDFVLNPLGLGRGLAERIRADANLKVLENQVNGIRYMGFNMRRKPMNDCSFRQAVAVLIDKEFVTQTILQGVSYPIYTFVPEGNAAWFSDEAPKLGQGLTREERVNLAVAILENAGYSWAGDQKPTWDAENRMVTPAGRLVMPDGTEVPELVMLSPSAGYDPLRSTFAIWIETWLNEFGIPLTAQLAGFNVIFPKIFTEQDFDLWILGWALSIFPDYLYDFLAEEQAVLDGNNAGGYINPEFEALAKQLLVCDEVEACKEISDEIQVLLATELPYVLLFDSPIIEAYRSASIEFPYSESLSGLQSAHQTPGTGLQASVKAR